MFNKVRIQKNLNCEMSVNWREMTLKLFILYCYNTIPKHQLIWIFVVLSYWLLLNNIYWWTQTLSFVHCSEVNTITFILYLRKLGPNKIEQMAWSTVLIIDNAMISSRLDSAAIWAPPLFWTLCLFTIPVAAHISLGNTGRSFLPARNHSF